jgi:hypothetical protein
MAGATVMTLAVGAVGPALFPLAVGLFLVVYASETSHVSVFSHDFKSLE